jgi:hypothetical protein
MTDRYSLPYVLRTLSALSTLLIALCCLALIVDTLSRGATTKALQFVTYPRNAVTAQVEFATALGPRDVSSEVRFSSGPKMALFDSF